MSSGLQGASTALASDDRPVCDSNDGPSSVLRADVRPSVSGHRRHDAVVGWPSGLCLPSVRPSASCAVEGQAIHGSGAHVSGFVLASAPLVSGASGGCSSVPPTVEGSTQTATLSLLSPEPPRASADCVSYIERSTLAFGFSASVVRQLAHCRRRSTKINQQANCAVFRSWCHRHGHSVSRPTIPKIASFLLYLRRSLSLSYSSIASYHSMLSGVFRFILPKLSFHFVLRDLLRSFCMERPLSSRVPPWDLSRVLSFLRGAPFEPLSSCSLRDLTRKVLFSVALATVWRVGELHSLSAVVSSSGEDLFFSYLLEFWAKAESEARPLARSFAVCSLRDFVGDLPEELLCLVHALRCCLSRTSLPSCPCSLFVSTLLRTCLSPLASLPLLFLLAPLPLLLALSLPSVLMGSGVSLLRGLFIGMLLSLLSWRPPLGLPPLSLLPSISLMSSSLPLRGLVWVRWWLRVQWFRSRFGCWFPF